DNNVINEDGRADLLEACKKSILFTEEDSQLFVTKSDYPENTVNKAQNAFNYMRVYLADKTEGGRIRGAEGYFLFYRGMFVASFWAAMIFLFVSICYLARIEWPAINTVLGESPTLLAGFILPLLSALISLYLWRTFRDRCRGAAQGFAKEVYRAFCAYVLIEHEKEAKN
ncbi:MAG: hypothetical protein ACW963_09605, partial [Candidatus Sifarchaeia archaeon]